MARNVAQGGYRYVVSRFELFQKKMSVKNTVSVAVKLHRIHSPKQHVERIGTDRMPFKNLLINKIEECSIPPTSSHEQTC